MPFITRAGIINSIGDLWKEQRRFLHVKLRQFGMTYMGNGRHLMEQRINTEITDLLQALTKTEGRPIDMSNVYAVGVSNVICNMMMSVRFSMDDPKFRRFTFLIEEGMRLFGEVHTVDYIPSVQYLPGKKSACNKIAQNRQDMFAFYREVIDEHKRTFVPGVVRDLIDAYLTEIDTAKKEGRDSELFEGKDHGECWMACVLVYRSVMLTDRSCRFRRPTNDADYRRSVLGGHGNGQNHAAVDQRVHAAQSGSDARRAGGARPSGRTRSAAIDRGHSVSAGYGGDHSGVDAPIDDRSAGNDAFAEQVRTSHLPETRSRI